MLNLFEDYLKELSYRLHGCNSLQEGAALKTAIQLKYFEKLFDLCVNNHQKVYILVGRRLDGDQPLQSLEVSFDPLKLEQSKIDYLNTFDCLYIEECMFV